MKFTLVLFAILSAHTIVSTADISDHEKKFGIETHDEGCDSKMGLPEYLKRNLTPKVSDKTSLNDFLHSGYYDKFYMEDEKHDYGKRILVATLVSYGLKGFILDFLDGLQFFGIPFCTDTIQKARNFLLRLHPARLAVEICSLASSYFKIHVTDVYDSLHLSYVLSKKSNDIKRDIENTKKQLARQYRRKATKYVTLGLTSLIGIKLLFSRFSRPRLSQSIEYPEPITKMYIGERIKQKYKFLIGTTTTDPNEKVIEKNVKQKILNYVKDTYYVYYTYTNRMKNTINNFYRRLFNRKNHERE